MYSDTTQAIILHAFHANLCTHALKKPLWVSINLIIICRKCISKKISRVKVCPKICTVLAEQLEFHNYYVIIRSQCRPAIQGQIQTTSGKGPPGYKTMQKSLAQIALIEYLIVLYKYLTVLLESINLLKQLMIQEEGICPKFPILDQPPLLLDSLSKCEYQNKMRSRCRKLLYIEYTYTD